MTEDKALLWARERCAQWYEAVDNHTVAAMFRVGERDYFQPLQARAEAFRAGQAEAEARVRALEAALQQISDLFGDAVQADCENGVRWLNERAAANYLKDAPETLAAIRKTQDIIATALESHPHD